MLGTLEKLDEKSAQELCTFVGGENDQRKFCEHPEVGCWTSFFLRTSLAGIQNWKVHPKTTVTAMIDKNRPNEVAQRVLFAIQSKYRNIVISEQLGEGSVVHVSTLSNTEPRCVIIIRQQAVNSILFTYEISPCPEEDAVYLTFRDQLPDPQDN